MSYDLIVIGGGTAGLVASAGAARLGARVALIEVNRLGGECLWNGCVPSKALLAAARAAADARGARELGVDADPQVDFARVMQWVRTAQERIEPHDSPERFRSLGVDVVQGHARFTGERTVQVDGRQLTARHIVIATGSRPAIPPVDGLAEVPYLTNETIFDVERLPERLLVLGGGPIGLELAQAFVRLGSQVQVLEAMEQLLPREDAELAAALGARLRSEGIEIHLGAAVRSARSVGSQIRLIAQTPAGQQIEFTGDALLVATGRKSHVEGLELQRAGVEADRGGPAVDDRLRTTADNVWASGDVTGGLRFTHVADYQSRLVLRNAFFPFSSRADYTSVPWVTYTEPELAHVGLTEDEARQEHGDDVRVWRRPFDDVDRAIIDGRRDGMVKVVTDSRGRILGAHILGHAAGEMINEIVLAMRHKVSVGALSRSVHPYPTYGEAIRQASEGFYKARLSGVASRIVRWMVKH